jgi:DNA-binding NarL/FixJ family response regulator
MSQSNAQREQPLGAATVVRVLVADDSYLMREGLRQLLALSDAVEVIGCSADQSDTLVQLELDPPDVLLTDIRMPPTFTDEGIQLSERLRLTRPDVGVVALSQESNVGYAARLLQDGASGRGYLLKDRVHDLEHLVSTLVDVSRGECRVDPLLVQQLVRVRSGVPSVLDSLTPRQLELLTDVAEGKSNAAIARDRFLSQRAVEKHVSEIFARLGIQGDADVSRRVRATLLYLDAVRP